MKPVKIVFWVLGILIFVMLAAYAYYGGFGKVIPTIEDCGGEILVYEKVTGDYKQSAQVSDRVYQKLLDDFGIETTKGFGIYYNNPEITEKEKLRSEVGCILESSFDKIDEIKETFEVTKFPTQKYLRAEFPYKGMPSIILGIMKVYPALNDYIVATGYDLDSPVMEIWDVPSKKIIYRKELVKTQQ
jgi:hypothetical protein